MARLAGPPNASGSVMLGLLVSAAGYIWRAVALKWVLDRLSPVANAHASRITYGSVAGVTVGLSMLWSALWYAGFLFPFGRIAAAAVWGVVYLGVYAWYFGIGLRRATVIPVAQFAAAAAFELLVRLLPGDPPEDYAGFVALLF